MHALLCQGDALPWMHGKEGFADRFDTVYIDRIAANPQGSSLNEAGLASFLDAVLAEATKLGPHSDTTELCGKASPFGVSN